MHRIKYGLEVLSVAIKECKESCKKINGCKHFSYCHYYSRLSTESVRHYRQRCSCSTIFQPALRMQAQLVPSLSELHNQQGTRIQDEALRLPSDDEIYVTLTFFLTCNLYKHLQHVQYLRCVNMCRSYRDIQQKHSEITTLYTCHSVLIVLLQLVQHCCYNHCFCYYVSSNSYYNNYWCCNNHRLQFPGL